MASNEKVKTKVGFFVFVSIIMLTIMVIYFGRLGDGLKSYYHLTAKFPNASGLLKGADVLMAGAKIGMVSDQPKIVTTENGIGVEVGLQIYEGIKVPSEGSIFVRRSGLLGDRYVEVIIRDAKVWDSPAVPPGGTISGEREAGMDDLFIEAKDMMAKVNVKIDEVGAAFTRMNETVLSKESLTQAQGAISNLNETSKNFADASKRIDGVLDDAEKAVSAGGKAMTDVQIIVQRAKNGEGMVGALLTDKTLAQNLRVFVENLRERGILFYKDVPAKPAPRR